MTEQDKCPHCDAEIYINDGDYSEWECGADKCSDGAGEWFHSRSSTCYEREIEQLRTELATLRAENERLTAENAKLREVVRRATNDGVVHFSGDTFRIVDEALHDAATREAAEAAQQKEGE